MARPRGGEEVNLFILNVENMFRGMNVLLHHVARPPPWTHGNHESCPPPWAS